MQRCSHASLPLAKCCTVLPVPNDHVWKKLQFPHLKSPAKSSSSLTQFLQALRSELMLVIHSHLAQARMKKGSEDAFGDVVVMK